MIRDLPLTFFRDIPREPGVYLMFSSQGFLIYVGKAKNLKRRIASYRTEPKEERATRKLRHLRRMVSSIRYEVLDSEEAALLRENELLRQHKPLFNRVNTRPRSYPYLLLQKKGANLWSLSLSSRLPEREEDAEVFGAFKAKRLAREALESLGRLHRRLNVGESRVDRPQSGVFYLNHLQKSELSMLLRGQSTVYLENLFLSLSASWEGLGSLEQDSCDQDILCLRKFFETCCLRNFEILKSLGSPHSWVRQEHLDDAIVRARFVMKEVGHVV